MFMVSNRDTHPVRHPLGSVLNIFYGWKPGLIVHFVAIMQYVQLLCILSYAEMWYLKIWCMEWNIDRPNDLL